jgi:ribosomal protein S27E
MIVGFLWLATGSRRVMWQGGLLLLVVLGGFALGTLTPVRGLLWTIAGLVLAAGTLLLWSQHAVRPVTEPEEEGAVSEEEEPPLEPSFEDEEAFTPDELWESTETSSEPAEEVVVAVTIEPQHVHCPHCGRKLSEDHSYCPGCGQSTAIIVRCPSCDHSQVFAQPQDATQQSVHCLRCGQALSTGPQAREPSSTQSERPE